MKALVWVFPLKSEVMVSEDLSPPVEGYGIGVYETAEWGWGEAGRVAKEKAKTLGFKVEYVPLVSDLP